MNATLPKVTIYTDGACSGNPGPGGWGVLLSFGSHKKELSGGEIETTNNRMELTAALEALKALTRTQKHIDKKAIAESSSIRRTALAFNVPYTTTLAGARATVLAIKSLREGELAVKTIQEYHDAES